MAKRGRPRKNVESVESVEEVESKTNPIPKKRGRPRKNSLVNNDNSLDSLDSSPIVPKKRGRPKKIFTPKDDTLPPVPTRTSKVEGYCPHCANTVCGLDVKLSGDINGELLFVCFKCGKEISKKLLLVENPNKQSGKYKNKKEYMEDCYHVSYDIIPEPPHTPIIKEDMDDLTIKDEE